MAGNVTLAVSLATILLKNMGLLLAVCVFAGCAGEPIVIPATASEEQDLVRTPEATAVSPEQLDAGAGDVFIFAAPEHQGVVGPRSGRLSLIITDLSVGTRASSLHLQRRLTPQGPTEGLLGSRWRLNWEIHLDRFGSMAMIHDFSGPVLLTADASGKEFRSAGGEKLVVGDDQATYTRLDGGIDVFDAEGRLVRREVHGREPFVLSYDDRNQLRRIDGPDGSFVQFVTDDAGRAIGVQASDGASVRYGYGDGGLVEVATEHGIAVAYGYDQQGLIDRIEHPQFGWVAFRYDDRGRVLSRGWIDGSRETWSYDDPNRTVRHTDAAGAVTTYRTSADRRREETVDALGHTTVITYNEAGRIHQATGPTGRTLTNTYDAQGRLTQMEVPEVGAVRFGYRGEAQTPVSLAGLSGEKLSFDYDADNQLVGIREPGSPGMSFEYGPGGTVESMKACGGHEVSFTYDARGRVQTVSDAPGRTVEFEHDAAGNLIRERNPLGGVTSRTYDAAGRLTSVRKPDGAATQYHYSPSGLLTEIVEPGGASTRYAYRGRSVTVTDPADRSTVYTHDAVGRLESITDGNGSRVRFEYDAAGNLVRSINPLGGVTTRDYDSLGRLVEERNPAGGATRYEYDGGARLARAVGPTGESRSYEYDGKGQLTKVSDSAGREMRYEYDDAGRLVKAVDSDGGETHYEYTDCGHLTKLVPRDGPVTELAYYESGNVAEVVRADQVISYEYDPLHHPAKETHRSGLEIDYRYDAAGNLLGQQDNLGGSQSMRYDPRGRLIEIRDSTGAVTRFRRDLAGNVLSVMDPLGHAMRYQYTAAGELARVVEPNGDTAAYEYDQAGDLTTLRHPGGGKTAYVYDRMGNVREATDPVGNSWRSTYDAAGRLTSATDANGQKTTYAYDAAGRLIQKQLADGTVVGYQYDRDGNLIEADDGVFPVRYRYDAFGNVVCIEYPAIEKTLHYRYDKLGRLVEFTDFRGRTIAYAYDALDRLTSIETAEDGAISFAYDPKDRLASLVFPNGVTSTWQYDGENRVVRITYTDSSETVISGREYKYDAAGNPVEVTDSDGRTARYAYDPSGQLVVETTRDDKKIKYTYAPGGNRASREIDGRTITYRYDEADRLVEAGDESFAYDANGNLVQRKSPQGTTRYEYDAEDRLVQVALPDGEVIGFGYAPTGERIWRRDSTGKTYFITDGVNLLAELDDRLEAKATYLHGPGIDRPLMMADGREKYFYHADAIGTITGLTDSTGRVAAKYQSDAFGNLAGFSSLTGNPFVFTGREYEADLNLYYYRARYYDPVLGRFLTKDPADVTLNVPSTLNPYQYAHNSPLVFTDPLGANTWDASLFPWFDAKRHRHVPRQSSAPTETTRGQHTGYDTVLTYPAAGPKNSASWWMTLRHEFDHLEHQDWFEAGGGTKTKAQMEARAYARTSQFGVRDLGLPVDHPEVQRQLQGFREKGQATPVQQRAFEASLRRQAAQRAEGSISGTRRTTGQQVPLPSRGVPRHAGGGPASQVSAPLAPSPGPRPTASGASSFAPQESLLSRHAGKLGAATIIAQTVICLRREGDLAQCAWQATLAAAFGSALKIGAAAVGVASGGAVAAPTIVAGAGAFMGARSIKDAYIEGTGMVSDSMNAYSEEIRAQARAERLRDNRLDDAILVFEKEHAELVRMATQMQQLDRDADADVAAAKGAAAAARNTLGEIEQAVSTLRDTLADAEGAEAVKEGLEMSAATVEQEADAVVARLDQVDLRAGNVDSTEERQQVLNAYAEAETAVNGIVATTGEVRWTNVRLGARSKQIEAFRDSLNEIDASGKIAAEENRIVSQIIPAIERKGAQIAALREQLVQGKASLLGRIGRFVTALPEQAHGVDRLMNLQQRVAGFAVPMTGNIADKVEEARLQQMRADNYRGQAHALTARVGGVRVAVADEAVARAEAAEKRAVDRLAQSRPLRDQVAAWKPGQTPELASGFEDMEPAGEANDLWSGFEDVEPAGEAADLWSGFEDVEPAREPEPSDVVGAEPSTPGRTPTPPTRPDADSPAERPDADQPLYAVYGVHPYPLPELPPEVVAGGWNAMEKWIDGLKPEVITPSPEPASYLVYKVEGEMLAEYQRHQEAVAAGTTEDLHWLFVPNARYHVKITIAGGGFNVQAPLFLSFRQLARGELPARYRHARIEMFAPLATIENPRTLSDRQSLGGGWRFEKTFGPNRVTYTAGPIEYDLDHRWQPNTLQQALPYAKLGLKIGAGAGDWFRKTR